MPPTVAPSLRGADSPGALEIVVAEGPLLEAWRTIHHRVIWTTPMSADEVAERSTCNRLTLAHATVRPPHDPDRVVTVIVRVLPEHRRGYGAAYLAAELAHAHSHGFVEHARYVIEGDEIPFVDLHLP